MREFADTRFLQALREVATAQLGAGHAVVLAARGALAGQAGGLTLQRDLAALDPAAHERLMAAVHMTMRRDISAIWDLLPGGTGDKGRMN